MDTCIKAGSYCPVCKGVVGRDCWHYASEFKRGANYAEEFFAAKDEIESLRQQLASAQEELHFQACLTRDLMPYQERALKSEQQLAAAKFREESLINTAKVNREGLQEQLAATQADLAEITRQKNRMWFELAAALAACEAKDTIIVKVGEIASPYRDGLKFNYIADLSQEALAIKPDASALKAHDEALIERCAEVCEEYQGSSETCASAIRALKGTL